MQAGFSAPPDDEDIKRTNLSSAAGERNAKVEYKQARANNFELLSQSPEKNTRTLQLEEVATDGHPGELVTCMPHPQCEVHAELGILYNSVLHRIVSARDSRVAFVTRLPEGLPFGEYWLRLVSSHPGIEPSRKCPIHVAPKPTLSKLDPQHSPELQPMIPVGWPALQPIPMILPPAGSHPQDVLEAAPCV